MGAKMPSFRKRNGRIQAQVRVSGSRQSATFSSLKEAKVWAFKLEAKLMANHHVSHRYRPTNPAEILIEYSSRLVESRPSALNEKIVIKALLREDWPHIAFSLLSKQHLLAWQMQRLKKIKGFTFNRQFSIISEACRMASEEWDWDFPSDALKIKRAKVSKQKLFRRVTQEQFEAIFAAGGKRKCKKFQQILILALETGLRRSELCNLMSLDIDFKSGVVFVNDTKNGFPRLIPMTPRALDAAMKLATSSTSEKLFEMSENAIRMAFEKARSFAGLPSIRFHDLRHEAISRFFEAGLTPPEVAAISGHRTMSMLMRYSHASLEKIQKKLIEIP
ncbi:MAG: hypothetical protein CMM80_05320 [Rhodospirillaceae bacterium]|nr:hypothetical protein [Rhodospirillaceae bacterium]